MPTAPSCPRTIKKKLLLFVFLPIVGLCRDVVVSKCCCVGMLLCRNGFMSGYVVVIGKMSGDERTDNLMDRSYGSFVCLLFH